MAIPSTKLQPYSMKMPEWLIYRLEHLINRHTLATSRAEAIRLSLHLLARDFFSTREVLRNITVTNGDGKLLLCADPITFHLPNGLVIMIEQFVDERAKLLIENGVDDINSFSVIIRYAVYRWVTFWEDRCKINPAKYCYDCKTTMEKTNEIIISKNEELNEKAEWVECPECFNTRLFIHS